MVFSISSSLAIECYNCEDCNTKINQASPGATITLKQDILNAPAEGCIRFWSRQNLTFDCKSNQIVASSRASQGGIAFNSAENIVLKNCIVKNYITGVDICLTNNSRIENVKATDNNIGIYFGHKLQKSDYQF